MRNIRYAALFIMVFLLGAGGTQLAQEGEDTPDPVRSVAFVDGDRRNLDTALTSDIGADGVTRLVEQFVRLGGRVTTIDLSEPVPDEIELVVLMRPRRGLTPAQTTYLWQFVLRGGHLLLTFDPAGHNGVRGEAGRGGISTLLDLETGLSLDDNLLIEPWLDQTALSNVVTSWSDAQAEPFVPHPITEPLLAYDLPLRFWGGRSLSVAGITGTSETNALIITERPFGETDRIRLNPENPPYTFEVEADAQGRLVLGAITTYYETGSRIALIGDGEFFLNIYGQTRNATNDDQPGFPGNFIFTQRLLAWLMGIPEEDWLDLPGGFTWLALDGTLEPDPTDWPARTAEFEGNDALTRVQAFHNDRYLYMALETADALSEQAAIVMNFDGDIMLRFSDGEVTQIRSDGTLTTIIDAEYVIGERLEARLPRRVVGDDPVLNRVCVLVNCLEQSMASRPVPQIDPVPVRFDDLPSAFTVNTANMRVAPTTDALRLAQFPARSSLAVLGRTEDAEWVQVADGRFLGWIATFLLEVNTDIQRLPVIELE